VRPRDFNNKEEFRFFLEIWDENEAEKEDIMAGIKTPNNKQMDYDFIAFCFNGKNSIDDFGIYRVSEGDKYNLDLTPTLQDITAEAQNMDGTLFFKTVHKQKVFNINFAFDNLKEQDLRELRKWLSHKDLADLWFPEEPYKVYSAKITGQPNIKYLCFDEGGQRKYKGEGAV
jgi:predicted phage tail component-like protein